MSALQERRNCKYAEKGCQYFKMVPRVAATTATDASCILAEDLATRRKQRETILGRLRAHQSTECRYSTTVSRLYAIRKALMQVPPQVPFTSVPFEWFVSNYPFEVCSAAAAATSTTTTTAGLAAYVHPTAIFAHGAQTHNEYIWNSLCRQTHAPSMMNNTKSCCFEPVVDAENATMASFQQSSQTDAHSPLPEQDVGQPSFSMQQPLERAQSEPAISHQQSQPDTDSAANHIVNIIRQGGKRTVEHSPKAKEPLYSEQAPHDLIPQLKEAALKKAESLVIDQIKLFQADLDKGPGKPKRSGWLNAVWLLAIVLPSLPPSLVDYLRPLVDAWRARVKPLNKLGLVERHMLAATYGDAPPPALLLRTLDQSSRYRTSFYSHEKALEEITALKTGVASMRTRMMQILGAPDAERRRQRPPCIKVAKDLQERSRETMHQLMDGCLEWHLGVTGAAEHGTPIDARMAECFEMLTRDVWTPLHEGRMFTAWLQEAAKRPAKTKRAMEAALDALL